MKAIFLDFDGVITTLESKWRLSPPHMEIVKKIIDKTGAKIVISSSWRYRDVETTLKRIFGEDCNLENCNFLQKNGKKATRSLASLDELPQLYLTNFVKTLDFQYIP